MNATVEDRLALPNEGSQIPHVIIADRAPIVCSPPTVGG